MKCEYLVSLSTTTNMTFLVPDLGKPSTKSIEIKDQAKLGIGKGASRPG
jgi:hypothetical protein